MKKSFQELTIKDAFMFAAVMADVEQCRHFLAMALDMDILEVAVVYEKTMSYHPEYHGVRLDVLADEAGTQRRFNVEMQVKSNPGLPKRTRYYHSQMDMDALIAGREYEELPDTYVIFICDFDPFGDLLYRYSFQNICRENGKPMKDGNYTVFLSTKGENDSEVPEQLVNFLKFVGSPENYCLANVTDSFVESLKNQIEAIKRNRDWEAKFMLLEEMLKDERTEGRLEGKIDSILSILCSRGDIPDNICRRIRSEKDVAVLDRWLLLAASTSSIDEFCQNM